MLAVRLGHGGPPLGWTDLDCCTFLLGVRTFELPVDAGVCVLLGAAGLLVLGGLLRTFASWRTAPLAAVAVAYACLYMAYHPAVRGRPHDTFIEFKICQWAFPLALVLEIAGLQWLFQRLLGRRRLLRLAAVSVACLALLVLSAPGRWHSCQDIVQRMQFLMDSPKPFQALRQLRRKLDERGVRRVLLLNPSGAVVPGGFGPFMLYPRSFFHLQHRWWPSCDPGDMDVPAVLPDDMIVLMIGRPSFEPAGERWPCGLWRVDSSTPMVVRFTGKNGLERWPEGQMFSWLDAEPARLDIWSPATGPVLLSFTAFPGPSASPATPRHLRISGPGGQPRSIEVVGTQPVSEQFNLAAGMNHVELQCLDQPTITCLPNGDPRTLLLGIHRLRLQMGSSP